jgi:hypothetical protein
MHLAFTTISGKNEWKVCCEFLPCPFLCDCHCNGI